MSDQAALHLIPPELIIKITARLTDADLKSVRKVCRELAAGSHDDFVRRFFTKRYHLTTEYGLRALADLSKYRFLVQKLKEIHLVSVAAAEAMGYINTRLLERGLTNLRQHGTSPAIFIDIHWRSPSPDRPPFGLAEYLRTHPDANAFDLKYLSCDSLIFAFFSAAAVAGFPLSRLNIHTRADNVHEFSKEDIAAPAGPQQELEQSWSTLKALSLTMVENDFLPNDNWMTYRHDGLAHLVSNREIHTDNCQIPLEANWAHYGPYNIFSWVLNACNKLSKLSSVELDYMSVSVGPFIKFLKVHRATLRRLYMSKCYASPGECWSTIFPFLQESCKLSRLDIQDLARDGRPLVDYDVVLMTDGNGCTRFRFVGRKTVKAGLKRLTSTDWTYELEW